MQDERQVSIAYIGAGGVNFGGAEGPWDHASRFESIPGVRCVGVADVDLPRAEAALAARRAGPHADVYAGARAFADWRAMLDAARPQAVVVGLPPHAHGREEPPGDVELQLARRGVAMLIEKPLSVRPPREVAHLAAALRQVGAIAGVGYMFRYARAVERLREVLASAPGGARVFLARYDCAYSEIAKADWWDARRSGGPVVEQATHFLDLARWLCGEVDLASVQAARIAYDQPAGRLADLPASADGRAVDAGVPPASRVPRATLAQWRFASGALGALAHGVLLHGRKYEAAIEVWGDGLRCVLEDPYGRCRLGVRRSGSEETVWESFDDDPYLAEDRAFIEAVRARSAGPIRSTYDDALQTYRLSWRIAHAEC